IDYKGHQQIILADIPGIIKNAYKGAGLGLKFLGHIEKCNQLLHFLDINKKNIINDYNIIRDELNKYGKDLENKKEILVLTKSDLITEKASNKILEKLQNYTEKLVYIISIKDQRSIEKLVKYIAEKKDSNNKEKKEKWTP
ncbi:MAG: GTPase, partial [Pseudomonadota bacterium]|nr:GTPase [Pseudomonadota bacterium]